MKLNKWQQAVIDNLVSGPQVVEACPGSGKTMTTEVLVPALLENGVDPLKLLVVTFSNKAASESRRRIAAALFPSASDEELAFYENPKNANAQDALKKAKGWHSDSEVDAWVKEDPIREMIVNHFSTIHALSLRSLKWLGYDFKVMAPNGNHNRLWWDAQALVKDGVKELDWDVSHKSVQWWFGAAINSLVEPHDAEQWFADQLAVRGGPVWDAPKLAELYKRYRAFCKRHQALDFNMMQANLVQLLRQSSRVREKVAGRFDVLVVDEAQDTSPIQCEILWTMAARTGRIVFVGDPDQACYFFRGAEPEVLRSLFEAYWGEVKRFNLPVNYRSTREIIRVTAELIKDNYDEGTAHYLKPFKPRPDAPEGDPITYFEAPTFNEMTEELAAQMIDNPSDWFVLSRTRAECAAIHTKLIELGVPAINKSGGMLFGTAHVRKVLAYARLACDYQNARDDVEILAEIANVATAEFVAPMNLRRHVEGCSNTKPWVNCGCPFVYEKGVDLSAVRFYGRKAVEKAGSWQGVIRQQDETNRGGYPTVASVGAKDLVRFIGNLERLADDSRACLQAIIEGSVLNWLKHDQGLDDEDLAENGKSEDFDLLVNMTEPDETMEQYLEQIDKLTAGSVEGDESESVLIGTVHWSKGAQRPKVAVNTTRLPIIPPSPRAGQLPTTDPPTPEEERRLLFVAMTRAQDECHLFGSQEWNGQGMGRSEFVQGLINKGLVEISGDLLPCGFCDGTGETLIHQGMDGEPNMYWPCPICKGADVDNQDKLNWLSLYVEPTGDDDGDFFLSFEKAGGDWWNPNYLDSLYEDLGNIKEEEEQIRQAAEEHQFCTVMIYGCGIVGTPPSWTIDGFDIGEAYLDYKEIEIIPVAPPALVMGEAIRYLGADDTSIKSGDWAPPEQIKAIPTGLVDILKDKTGPDVKIQLTAHDILAQFPEGGRFENTIYRPSAKELACTMNHWTPTVDNGQLVMEKDLGHGSTTVCYTGIKIGQIAGGTGKDSIRVVRRDKTDRGTFWYKEDYSWVARTIPQDCDTPEKAVAHLVQKIEERVRDFVRNCPKCSAIQFKCRAGKDKDARTWWKATCHCKIEDGW